MAGSGHSRGYNPVVSAQQLAANRRGAWIYAATFSGLISLFIIAHFARTLFQLSSSRRRSKVGIFSKIVVVPFRLYRRFTLRKLPKVSSGGHLLLILAYLGCNVALTLYDVEVVYPYKFFAKRCGWMAINNACLAFLLAMKNNPLSFLTGYSHERLNVLHRWVGRTIFVYSCLHVYVFVYSYVSRQNIEKLSELSIIYGWVAFACFNVIYTTSLLFLRKRFYEVFYVIHVAMFIVAVVFLGLHKPKKFAEVMYFVGALWSADRLIRTARMLRNSYNNTAILIPLAGLATKVVLSKSIWSQPGSHAFISIPRIRAFQSHPFTISSSSNVEFVIKAQKGFTMDLHKYALKNPGVKVKVWMDGPYGAVPDFGRFNRVVLLAGGSGGAFTFPIALDLVRNMGRFCVVAVEFVWVIRDERHLTWYESEIETLQKSKLVNLRIYVTSKTDTIVTSQPVEVEAAAEREVRNSLYIEDGAVLDARDLESGRSRQNSASSSSGSSGYHSAEKPSVNHAEHPALRDNPPSPSGTEETKVDVASTPVVGERSTPFSPPLRRSLDRRRNDRNRNSMLLERTIDQVPTIKIDTLNGRPDISVIVKSVVRSSEERDLVAVAACGPVELMRVARNAVADSIEIGGPSVTLHCEQFGWG